MIREQHVDPTRMRAGLNKGDDIPFQTNDQCYLVSSVNASSHIVVPWSLNQRLLKFSRHVKVDAHRGGGKL